MTRRTHRPLRRLATGVGAVAALVAGTGVLAPGRSAAATTGTNKVGVVCTTSNAGTPTFDLSTTAGYIDLPDGNTVYMLGYAVTGQPFQHPSPVLCVNQGDTVTVTLHNTLNRRTSIMFPGQENVLANGNPAQPELSGSAITSLTTSVAAGTPASPTTITYTFVASNPGTYLYESGTDPETQVHVGLFGALIVHPSLGAGYAYNRADSKFTAGEEFMVLLSEVDPYLNQAVEANQSFNFVNYHPRYWLVNGRGFPDSIADNFASWLPNQPYGALARIHEFNPATHPDPGLARYLNVGTEDFPFHPHGNNGSIIGRDGHALEGPGGEDLSLEKFSLNIGPGQAWDVLFKWRDAEQYKPAGVPGANPVPVTVPEVASQEFGMFYSGSPYLGVSGVKPPGFATLNQCGEYYIIAHNHALYQITSWGVNMTGPITYMRIDPPTPNTCG
jgi:FtsP/CotA-like multicopper oxidase with cupredoxin domain